jgi:SAM-dependent methyltransferase
MDGLSRAKSALSALYEHILSRQGGSGNLQRSGAALKTLQRGLTGDRALAGSGYFSTEEILNAYLMYYWPVSFMQTSFALAELECRGVLPKIERVLDLGAGPGPASFAAFAWGAKQSILVDSIGPALHVAQELSIASGLGNVQPVQADLSKDGAIPEGPYDLVVASHSMNELWKNSPEGEEKRASLLARASQELSSEGILLILEPSAAITAIPALRLRDKLLDPRGGFGLRCLGPCLDSNPCPALKAGEGRSCHSTWAWDPLPFVAGLAAQAGLDRDSVKATWFALGKTDGAKTFTAPSPLLEQEGASISALSGRIVSDPLLNKAGRLRYIVCTGPVWATLSAKSGDESAKAAGFFSLRRGDLIQCEDLEKREGQNSFGFGQLSRMRIK